MSTLNAATLASDDEEDQDFVPTAPKPKRKRKTGAKQTRAERDGSASASGSSSGSDSDDDDVGDIEEGEAKRLKLEEEEAEAKRRKEAAKEAYRSLLEGDEPTPSKVDKVDQREMVEVKRPRQFAGETIYEIVSLRKDDPEAVAYLARIAKEGHPAAGTIGSAAAPGEGTQSTESVSSTATPASTPAAPASAQSSPAPVTNSSTTPLPPKVKGPIRRKPRQSLEAMSAALDKGRKMTTLEKSQMDWKTHTSADPTMQSELEANRRGGGFLEKQQFLDRVGDRRTGALEGAKSGSRR